MNNVQSMTSCRGCFITLEGIEGVGKSTSLDFIQNYLSNQGLALDVTREPGGTPIAEAIRRLLLAHHDETMCADTELLMLFAARAQHCAQRISPALEAGSWVVSDRFTDASYAYQGAGRSMEMQRIAALDAWLRPQLVPDLVLLLDAPVEVALARAKERDNPDRFELEQQDFFKRIRAAYLQRAREHPARYRVIDASLRQQAVYQQIQQVLDEFIVRFRSQNAQ